MAKIQVSLADEDRERIGGPEWLDVDIRDFDIDDCIDIQEATGLDFFAFRRGFPNDPRAFKAVVWIALRHAGIVLDFAELHFKAYQGKWSDVTEGKAPEAQGESQTSETS